MPREWIQEFEKLKGYINSHPEIEITQTKWSIPEETKENFYSAYDSVREALVKQYDSDIINESEALAVAYREAAEEATNRLHLDGIKVSPIFDIFLQSPKAALIKPLFNPLYDLLKGRIDACNLEKELPGLIDSFNQRLKVLVYEKWLVLSFINLLKPDELYCCPIKKRDKQRKKYRIQTGRKHLQEIPKPLKTNLLSWEYDPMVLITPADFIIHTSALKKNKYIAIKTRFVMATQPAILPENKREWLKVNTDFKLDEDVILFYVADNPIDICLLAHDEQICRPDLVIKYRGYSNGELSRWLDIAKGDAGILQPASGFFLTSKNPLVIQNNDLESNMHLLDTGLSETKLLPVILKLFNEDYAPGLDAPYKKVECKSEKVVKATYSHEPAEERSSSFTRHIMNIVKRIFNALFSVFTTLRVRNLRKPGGRENTLKP